MKLARLRGWSTRSLAWLALAVISAAWLGDDVNWPLKVQFGIPYRPLEYLSSGMGILGWAFLLILLPVAAFRPDTRFSLKGDCRRRAGTFAFVLMANLVVYVVALGIMLTALA